MSRMYRETDEAWEAWSDPLVRYEDDPITDNVHHPYTAFNQGFDAHEQGIPASLNPYPDDSREAHWWEMGYECEDDNDGDCLV